MAGRCLWNTLSLCPTPYHSAQTFLAGDCTLTYSSPSLSHLVSMSRSPMIVSSRDFPDILIPNKSNNKHFVLLNRRNERSVELPSTIFTASGMSTINLLFLTCRGMSCPDSQELLQGHQPPHADLLSDLCFIHLKSSKRKRGF